MLLYNLWPVEGLKVGQKWQKFIFFDTLSLTPYLDHLLKSDLHQIDKEYLTIPLYNWVVCILWYCITFILYKGRKLVKNGKNSFFDTLFGPLAEVWSSPK